MKTYKASIFFVSFVAFAAAFKGNSVEAEPVSSPQPMPDIHITTTNPVVRFSAPIVKDAKFHCGSRSLSSVSGTIRNNSTTTQSYTAVFTGQYLDECIEPTYPDCSNLPPGYLCMPNGCNKYKAGEIITVKAAAVTLPVNGEKTVMISIPNRDFKTATFSAGLTKATVVPLPKTCLF